MTGDDDTRHYIGVGPDGRVCSQRPASMAPDGPIVIDAETTIYPVGPEVFDEWVRPYLDGEHRPQGGDR